jgi:hypothetical protein
MIDAANTRHASNPRPWRVACACQGDFAVDSLKPEFQCQEPLAQFIQGLYCERCGIGYVPERMAKPSPPRYKGTREGFRRVYPDGTLGPPLQRIVDDPDRDVT